MNLQGSEGIKPKAPPESQSNATLKGFDFLDQSSAPEPNNNIPEVTSQ